MEYSLSFVLQAKNLFHNGSKGIGPLVKNKNASLKLPKEVSIDVTVPCEDLVMRRRRKPAKEIPVGNDRPW